MPAKPYQAMQMSPTGQTITVDPTVNPMEELGDEGGRGERPPC